MHRTNCIPSKIQSWLTCFSEIAYGGLLSEIPAHHRTSRQIRRIGIK